MNNRRDFIKTGLITAAVPALILADIERIKRSRKPMVIPTWNHGIEANKKAMKMFKLLFGSQLLNFLDLHGLPMHIPYQEDGWN